MSRGLRDGGSRGLGDYDDLRSYSRQGGSGYSGLGGYRDSGYVDRPTSGSSYGSAGSGLGASSGAGYEREIMESLIQQRALQQQLSLRESQLALANTLLQQQQQAHIMNKRSLDFRHGDYPRDFKRPRSDPRSWPRDRQRGRDSDAGSRSSSSRRGQNSPGSRNTSRRSSDIGIEHRAPKRAWRAKRVGKKRLRKSKKTGMAGNAPGTVKKTVDENSNGTERNGSKEAVTSNSVPTSAKSVLDVPCDSLTNAKSPEQKLRKETGKDSKEISDSSKAADSNESKQRSSGDNGVKDEKQDRRGKGFCRVCDVPLTGSFLHHQRLSFHRKRKVQVTKGCGWCGVPSFNNFSEVLEHRDTEQHIKNQKVHDKKDGRDYKRRDSQGKDKPKEREPLKIELPPELEKYDSKVVTGQNCVIPVTGWFCKLCNKFYNNETAAKETHCMTEPHFNNYKKLISTKLRAKAEAEREAREKAAEEEEKKKEAEAAAEEEQAAENAEEEQGGNGELDESKDLEDAAEGLGEEKEVEGEEEEAQEEEEGGGEEELNEEDLGFSLEEIEDGGVEPAAEEEPLDGDISGLDNEQGEDFSGVEELSGAVDSGAQAEDTEVTEEAKPVEKEEAEVAQEENEAETSPAVKPPSGRGRGRGGGASRARRGRKIAK